jgi:hypothetical protein
MGITAQEWHAQLKIVGAPSGDAGTDPPAEMCRTPGVRSVT